MSSSGWDKPYVTGTSTSTSASTTPDPKIKKLEDELAESKKEVASLKRQRTGLRKEVKEADAPDETTEKAPEKTQQKKYQDLKDLWKVQAKEIEDFKRESKKIQLAEEKVKGAERKQEAAEAEAKATSTALDACQKSVVALQGQIDRDAVYVEFAKNFQESLKALP